MKKITVIIALFWSINGFSQNTDTLSVEQVHNLRMINLNEDTGKNTALGNCPDTVAGAANTSETETGDAVFGNSNYSGNPNSSDIPTIIFSARETTLGPGFSIGTGCNFIVMPCL